MPSYPPEAANVAEETDILSAVGAEGKVGSIASDVEAMAHTTQKRIRLEEPVSDATGTDVTDASDVTEAQLSVLDAMGPDATDFVSLGNLPGGAATIAFWVPHSSRLVEMGGSYNTKPLSTL